MTYKFTTRFTHKPSKGLTTTQESKTFQECKDDVDLNVLYKKYLARNLPLPNVSALEQRYGDISNAQSYEEMLNIQNDVKVLFDTLPADIRFVLNYNVDKFVDLISTPQDDANSKELQNHLFEKLGMKERKQKISDLEYQEMVEDKLIETVSTPVAPTE